MDTATIISLALSESDIGLVLTALVHLRDELEASGGTDEATEKQVETLIEQFEEL